MPRKVHGVHPTYPAVPPGSTVKLGGWLVEALIAPTGTGGPIASAGARARYRIHRPGSDAKDDVLYTPPRKPCWSRATGNEARALAAVARNRAAIYCFTVATTLRDSRSMTLTLSSFEFVT